jgi:hypothetical protein
VRDGDGCFVGPAPTSDLAVLGSEVASLGPHGCARGLDQSSPEPWVAAAGADVPALACRFVASWAHAGPGREIGGGGESGHVGTGLGDDHVDRKAIEPGNWKQRLVDRLEHGGPSIDLFRQRTDRFVEEVHVSEDATAGNRVVGAGSVPSTLR